MNRNCALLPLVSSVLMLCVARAALAAAPPEAWADPALPVKGGLVAWYDAARQPAAHAAGGKAELRAGDAIGTLFDGSGNGRHVTAPSDEARPQFIGDAKGAAVRLDGLDDHLLLKKSLPRLAGGLTIVVVAAPRSNPGGFSAMLSANEEGKNDFVTGVNLDLGLRGSRGNSYDVVNAEGAGFGRATNLFGQATPFERLKTFALTAPAGGGEVVLHVDGVKTGARPRADKPFTADSLALGARRYNQSGGPAESSGFFDGDIAEVLVFDRVLSAEELAAVHGYLSAKHKATADVLAKSRVPGRSLRRLENPPDVQMFVPGFVVRQLPLDLTNINNVRYREDGKLVALAYDGNVYLLSDTDGDGLEDKADLYWDNQDRISAPIGMALTPPGYARGRGLFVAAKGKLSLIADTDGDDKADKETVVASGWPGTFHQVDALGVAMDKDQNVYFGIGCANFADAYLRDKEGKSHYDLKSERGTILKVSADLSKREILVTGIRFPVGLAFNRHGDLFATDQEGATWLPNGNPLDELLHIQRGRHYGFPPRHPRDLPGVIDEPSTFDYAPQHQSTCGLFFNESVNGGPTFGPAFWAGDALVTGESRGKLYRTKLAKANTGYVATNQLIGSLMMLAVDSCVSPAGDLVVAVHSGNPDWGSGPRGKGRLYKVIYRERDLPQPVATWAASPEEVCVAFDKPLDPAFAQRAAKEAAIEYGPYVAAGDRFEVIWPGYAVVQRQIRTPRQRLEVTGARLSDDRRTLILSTARQSHAVGYAVALPGLAERPAASDEIPQLPQIDLAYDLTGVAAQWEARESGRRWSGWLPHPDLSVADAFTAGSATHGELSTLLKEPGRLTMRTSIDLSRMLRPAVQPGSHLDYTLPPETVTVTFQSNAAMTLTSSDPDVKIQSIANGATMTVTPKPGRPIPVELTLQAGGERPALTVAFTTAEDSRTRPMPVRRFRLPWARPEPEGAKGVATAEKIPELEGGDWARGRQLFFGKEAACSTCHRVRGEGSDLGPDLSNLVHRDYDSVLRDIKNPSGSINPDYVSSTVRLKDGRVLAGIVREAGPDHILVRGDAQGEKPIARTEVQRSVTSKVSLMPAGIAEGLGAEKMRDLLTFLLTEPLAPAALERAGAPPARSRADVEAVLKEAIASTRPVDLKPLRVLLVAGPKDHGPGEHDYPLWRERWSTLLSLASGVTVATADRWPSPEQFARADVAVFYSANPDWNEERAKEFDTFLSKGGGAVFIHFACNGQKHPEALAERIGLAWRNGGSRFRHGPVDLAFRDPSHPITKGFGASLRLVDESYWNLAGDPGQVHLLAETPEEGQPRPMFWTYKPAVGGRVAVSIAGHYTWTFDDPLFRVLLLRAICWTADQPADRLSNLATTGARVRDGF